MIRFIFARHQLYSPGAAEDITHETILVNCPEVEQGLSSGGRELYGLHDFTRLVGVEIVQGTEWQLWEYRVCWKRTGKGKRSAIFASLPVAEKCAARVRDRDGHDDQIEVPELEYLRIEKRAVGQWMVAQMIGTGS